MSTDALGTLGDLAAALNRRRAALEDTLEALIGDPAAPLVWERTRRGRYESSDGQFVITSHGNYFGVSQLTGDGWISLGGQRPHTLAQAKADAEAAR